eukprot:SAG31_NODE_2376_length_5841_cov_10.199060_7_plen_78_part_00
MVEEGRQHLKAAQTTIETLEKRVGDVTAVAEERLYDMVDERLQSRESHTKGLAIEVSEVSTCELFCCTIITAYAHIL